MNLQDLNKRLELIQNEFEKTKAQVAQLTEQLEQSKIHLNTIHGHWCELKGFCY